MPSNPLTSPSSSRTCTPDQNTDSSEKVDLPSTAVEYDSVEEVHSGIAVEERLPSLNALYAQYYVVGFVYGVLPGTLYGLYMGYLRVDSHVYSTAAQVIALPWSFKFMFGMLNDCQPLFGYRRVSYMALGWAICGAALAILANTPMPVPGDSSSAGLIACKMAVAACGYVMADVAADGLLVQYAKREQILERGKTQSTVYFVRTLGSITAAMFVGLCMNGVEYNGTFSHTLSFNQICAVAAVPAIIMAPVSWVCIPEPVGTAENIREYLKGCWDVLSRKAMFYVVVYSLGHSTVGSITTTAGGNVSLVWAGVRNLQSQLFSVVGMGLFAFGLVLVRKYLLNYSWRKIIIYTTLLLGSIDSVFVFCTVFDVVRNQYFYLGEDIIVMVPAAARFLVTTFVVVEMAPDGKEGVTYGMLTTLHNLGAPIARALSNQIFGLTFTGLTSRSNYVTDTDDFRKHVALSYAISYACGLVALCFLYFLPDQKAEARHRLQMWERKPVYAKLTLSVSFFAWVYAVTLNMLVMVPSASCLPFLGGDGC